MSSFPDAFAKAKDALTVSGRFDRLRELDASTDEVVAIAERSPAEIKYLLWIRKLPFDALDRLARMGSHRDRMRIALKYPLARETYEFLAKQDDEIKVRLFSNKKLPPDIAQRLRDDPSNYVRSETARWACWRDRKR